jgi:hypothetical protein
MTTIRPRSATVRSTGRSALPPAELMARLVDAPLPAQFQDWLIVHGVAAVEGQDGPWRTVGQERVLRMNDGSRVSERLVAFAPGLGWTNVLSGFTNEVRHVLTSVDDDWRLTEDDRGTVVTWTWTMHPRPTIAANLLTHAMVAPLHRPYLQRILDGNLERTAAAEPVPAGG